MPDYIVQEEAINELFQGCYNSNKCLKNIIIKCSVLNDFYSTNIFKVYPVACHILELDIDERLKKGDISLVNEIANNKIANKEKNLIHLHQNMVVIIIKMNILYMILMWIKC